MIKSRLTAVMGLWQAKNNESISLRELAERTGLSRDFLSRFQRNEVRRLDLGKLQNLCTFFGVTPNDLLWEESDSESRGGHRRTPTA